MAEQETPAESTPPPATLTTPEDLRNLASKLRTAKDNLDRASLAAAAFALGNPPGGGAALVVLQGAAPLVEYWANEVEESARELDKVMVVLPLQLPSSNAGARGRGGGGIGASGALPKSGATGIGASRALPNSGATGIDAASGPGSITSAFDALRDAVSRIDDASLVIEAAGQELAGAAGLLKDTADRLGQRLDELFGERGGRPGEQGSGAEFQQIAYHPTGGGGQFEPAVIGWGGPGNSGIPGGATPLFAGSQNGPSLAPAIIEAGDQIDKVNQRIEASTAATFGRIEAIMIGALEGGKDGWRGYARVALDAIGAILEAQIGGLGASSSASGGGFLGAIGGILGGVLGGIFGGGGGGSNFLASAAMRTSKPGGIGGFEHGGRVATGAAVLVGEAGLEIFVPPAPGEIIPNDRLGGFGGGEPTVVIKYNIDARGAEPGVEQRIPHTRFDIPRESRLRLAA